MPCLVEPGFLAASRDVATHAMVHNGLGNLRRDRKLLSLLPSHTRRRTKAKVPLVCLQCMLLPMVHLFFRQWYVKDRGLGTNKHRFRTLSDVVTCGHGCPHPRSASCQGLCIKSGVSGIGSWRRELLGTAGNCGWPMFSQVLDGKMLTLLGWPTLSRKLYNTTFFLCRKQQTMSRKWTLRFSGWLTTEFLGATRASVAWRSL